MDTIPVDSSSDTASFFFSRKFRWMMIGCELGFIGFVIFALLLPLLDPGKGIWIVSAVGVAFFGGFAVMMMPVLRGLNDVVIGRPERFIWLAGILMSAVLIGFSWMTDPWVAVFFAGFALFCLGWFVWEPHMLEIHDDRLVLRSRIRERPIFFRDLIAVKFKYDKLQYSNMAARIKLHRVRGKPLDIGHFTAGAAPVFRLIRARWEKWLVDKKE